MSKLNAQGLARRNKDLMSCMVADDGYTFVSVDLAAGEPTIISHYSRDPNYLNASFNMVGKEPYYDNHGVLQIDDIYLMGMSVSPMGKNKMREVFNRPDFISQWMTDKEVVQKKWLKSERAFHKILMLGLGYSMGPKHMVDSAYKAGYILSIKDAKAFFKLYWDILFPELKNLRDILEAKFLRDGYLVNAFGYQLHPDPSYKALNYWIQSSVSGLMGLLKMYFLSKASYAEFVTVIHDEHIWSIPNDKLDDAKIKMDEAVDMLNKTLKWSVNMRTGWAVGKDFYEAK